LAAHYAGKQSANDRLTQTATALLDNVDKYGCLTSTPESEARLVMAMLRAERLTGAKPPCESQHDYIRPTRMTEDEEWAYTERVAAMKTLKTCKRPDAYYDGPDFFQRLERSLEPDF